MGGRRGKRLDTMMERIMVCIPPNPRRVGYIDPIHGLLDWPLYMGSHIHQHICHGSFGPM